MPETSIKRFRASFAALAAAARAAARLRKAATTDAPVANDESSRPATTTA